MKALNLKILISILKYLTNFHYEFFQNYRSPEEPLMCVNEALTPSGKRSPECESRHVLLSGRLPVKNILYIEILIEALKPI